MSRKAIVHIGPMKTGSSSIQAWLNQMREPLREAGFLVPASMGATNMSRLSYMAQVRAAGEDLTPADTERLVALREEIVTQPDSVGSVIFSGEMLAHHLKRPEQLAALKSMLDEFFEDYTIMVYLRRQDEFSLSRYSTALRHGFKRAQPLASPLDYETMLAPWVEAFGQDAILARIFDRKAMPQGDVVRDFAEALGLPAVGLRTIPINRNPSIRPEAQAFLVDLADRVRAAGFAEVFTDVASHEAIMRRLGQDFSGRGTTPARAEVIAFYDQVRASNERVRQAWFPDRETLFAEDFSDYSDEPAPVPTADELLEVAMSVLVALIADATPAAAGDADVVVPVPRRNAEEKKEMRDRRKRHRAIRARRRRQANKADDL